MRGRLTAGLVFKTGASGVSVGVDDESGLTWVGRLGLGMRQPSSAKPKRSMKQIAGAIGRMFFISLFIINVDSMDQRKAFWISRST
jgi:hypothetical protein